MERIRAFTLVNRRNSKKIGPLRVHVSAHACANSYPGCQPCNVAISVALSPIPIACWIIRKNTCWPRVPNVGV